MMKSEGEQGAIFKTCLIFNYQDRTSKQARFPGALGEQAEKSGTRRVISLRK